MRLSPEDLAHCHTVLTESVRGNGCRCHTPSPISKSHSETSTGWEISNAAERGVLFLRAEAWQLRQTADS